MGTPLGGHARKDALIRSRRPARPIRTPPRSAGSANSLGPVAAVGAKGTPRPRSRPWRRPRATLPRSAGSALSLGSVAAVGAKGTPRPRPRPWRRPRATTLLSPSAGCTFTARAAAGDLHLGRWARGSEGKLAAGLLMVKRVRSVKLDAV